VGDIAELIQKLHDPETSAEDYIKIYQKLINVGMVWADEAMADTALNLIQGGFCTVGVIGSVYPGVNPEYVYQKYKEARKEGMTWDEWLKFEVSPDDLRPLQIPSLHEAKPGQPGTPEYIKKSDEARQKRIETAISEPDRLMDEALKKAQEKDSAAETEKKKPSWLDRFRDSR
jgi:hypothetical protein